MCIEREKDNFKSREVNCLKECALALNLTKAELAYKTSVVAFAILRMAYTMVYYDILWLN